jgi:hypothetical protein
MGSEVSSAARILARDMAKITRGQEVLIYADYESDPLVVNENLNPRARTVERPRYLTFATLYAV